eukprot:TRINITY_DN4787_c0_g2_i1.p3 TRINITY_DN4787_c0_g2~~TRINITY_DN4787_c0_g2_i1.p3  ORF type:complete len:100 (+),score=1.98 TRINITY_DN4787_c0_g2_i1:920-1219(+)
MNYQMYHYCHPKIFVTPLPKHTLPKTIKQMAENHFRRIEIDLNIALKYFYTQKLKFSIFDIANSKQSVPSKLFVCKNQMKSNFIALYSIQKKFSKCEHF